MSFLATHLIGFGAGGSGGIAPFSTEYTTPGTQTVTKPDGAVSCIIECIGAGGNDSGPTGKEANYNGGGGGGYSKATISVISLTGIYISVPAGGSDGTTAQDAFAKQNSSGGTTVCYANGGSFNNGGSTTSPAVGDVKYRGGDAPNGVSANRGGAGAAGPSGNGSDGSGSTGGASGGSPGGAGGNNGANGSNYGGGAGSGGAGAGGYIKLSWS